MLDQESIEEKRAFKRFNLREPVRYELESLGRTGGSLSRDISEGGVQIRLTEFIPLNTQLRLEIQLNNGQIIESTGQVVWITQVPFMDHFHAGLQFCDPNSIYTVRKEIRLFAHSK